MQVYVSQLRKLLGKERVVTQPSSYLLRVEQSELDLARFQRLRAEGRLHDALALRFLTVDYWTLLAAPVLRA